MCCVLKRTSFPADCEAASSGATLEETVRNGARRERFCFALGHLSLPEGYELEPETVATIFEAFIDCLSEAQRLVFCGTEHGWLSAMREPDARVTVGDMLRFLRAAEERLRALGPVALGSPVSSGEKPQPNLIAAVYSYYLGMERLWSRFDGEAMRKLDRQRTDALLLQLGAVGLVDRYEARLRRDLTNTLRDLADLQDRRRDSRSRACGRGTASICRGASRLVWVRFAKTVRRYWCPPCPSVVGKHLSQDGSDRPLGGPLVGAGTEGDICRSLAVRPEAAPSRAPWALTSSQSRQVAAHTNGRSNLTRAAALPHRNAEKHGLGCRGPANPGLAPRW